MARLFRKKGARIAFGATSLGAAAAMMSLLITSGSAYGDSVLPDGSTGSYQLSASSAGLYLAIAGNQLTGGTASVSGTYSNTGTGAPTEDAKASGGGFLLSNAVLGTEPSVEAGGSTGTNSASKTQGSTGDPANSGGGSTLDVGGPSTPADCNNGGGQVSSGVGAFVGLGCGYAAASVDGGNASGFAGPQALAAGNMATASIDLGGILSQVYTGGASQLCTSLGQIPTLGPALQDTCTQVLSVAKNGTTVLNPSVQINVGNAYSQIVGTATKVFSEARSSSIDVSIFPGLDGSAVNSLTGDQPLLRLEIPAATAFSCEGTGCPTGAPGCTVTSNGWTNSYDSGVIRLSGVLINDLAATPLGQIPLFSSLLSTVSGLSELEIPPACAANGVEAVNTSPLGALLQIHLASATVSGSGVTGSGAQVELLPTQGPNGTPVVNLNTSGIQTAAQGSAQAAPVSQPQNNPPVLQSAQSPTSVHTGEWFAGSLPLLAVLAALGGGLLGWPRIRRLRMVARLSRGSR